MWWCEFTGKEGEKWGRRAKNEDTELQNGPRAARERYLLHSVWTLGLHLKYVHFYFQTFGKSSIWVERHMDDDEVVWLFFVARTKMKYFGQNPKPGKRHLIIQKKKVVDYFLLYLYLFSGIRFFQKSAQRFLMWAGPAPTPGSTACVSLCVCVSYADGWDLSQNSETEANSGTVWLQVVNVTLMSATCPGRVSFLPVSNEPQWGWTPCSPVPRPVLANEFLNKSVWGCRPHLTAPGQSCPLASFTPALHTILHM